MKRLRLRTSSSSSSSVAKVDTKNIGPNKTISRIRVPDTKHTHRQTQGRVLDIFKWSLGSIGCCGRVAKVLSNFERLNGLLDLFRLHIQRSIISRDLEARMCVHVQGRTPLGASWSTRLFDQENYWLLNWVRARERSNALINMYMYRPTYTHLFIRKIALSKLSRYSRRHITWALVSSLFSSSLRS